MRGRVPPRRRRTRGSGGGDARPRDSRKRSVVESPSAPRLARERDGENLSDEDEDVFATAPPSPMGSVASANGGSAGNEKTKTKRLRAGARRRARRRARARAARVTAETYIVEEGVLGCGDAACGEDGASCGDPVACLTKRFAAVGGPFKLPGVQIPRIDRTASTAASPPEAGPLRRAPRKTRLTKQTRLRDDASCDLSSREDESEAGESVAGTEEEDDDARTGEDETTNATPSPTRLAAGTERDDDDEADVCQRQTPRRSPRRRHSRLKRRWQRHRARRWWTSRSSPEARPSPRPPCPPRIFCRLNTPPPRRESRE